MLRGGSRSNPPNERSAGLAQEFQRLISVAADRAGNAHFGESVEPFGLVVAQPALVGLELDRRDARAAPQDR
jgi:hypothetical protein